MPDGVVPLVGADIYGHPVLLLLNGRSRIRNSLNQSRAATCRDFARQIRETGGYPENRLEIG
jgi:hypothetical protein